MDEQNRPKHPGEEHYYERQKPARVNDNTEPRSFSSSSTVTSPFEQSRRPARRSGPLVMAFVILGIIIVVAGGVLATWSFSRRSLSPSVSVPQSLVCHAHSSNPVVLTMYYDTEEQGWFTNVVSDFNGRKMVACDGPISVKPMPLNPGETMQGILRGNIQPDIWSPGSTSWLELINQYRQKDHKGDIVDPGVNASPSVLKSPVVIAMWQPMAQALGWPGKSIGWSDIYAVSTNPKGWAAYGHSEWGDFKFGHTDSNYSDSGRTAIIAENYAAVHKTSGLTLADVNKQTTRDFVAGVERSVIHYGNDTNLFANEMFKEGPSYLSAVVMNESSVVEVNTDNKYNSAYPVVAIYPKEGTFVSNHPLALLQASWVTPAKKSAEQVFRTFLLDTTQQKKALQYGLRPGISSIPFDTFINAAHGAAYDPRQPLYVLISPPHVIDIPGITKPPHSQVDVMLLLDCSGSMGDAGKIEGARAGLKEFVKQSSDDDNLGLAIFNDQPEVVVPIGRLGSERSLLRDKIQNITTSGHTSLFDAIAMEQKVLNTYPVKDIKALVVLTDGVDKHSTKVKTRDSLIQQISLTGNNAGKGVHIYTIAYGRAADAGTLQYIAHKTDGYEYPSSTASIIDVYTTIHSIAP